MSPLQGGVTANEILSGSDDAVGTGADGSQRNQFDFEEHDSPPEGFSSRKTKL